MKRGVVIPWGIVWLLLGAIFGAFLALSIVFAVLDSGFGWSMGIVWSAASLGIAALWAGGKK